jgi:hypothetical protein
MIFTLLGANFHGFHGFRGAQNFSSVNRRNRNPTSATPETQGSHPKNVFTREFTRSRILLPSATPALELLLLTLRLSQECP